MLSGDFFCLKLAHAGYVPYICNIKHREIEQSVARRAHNPKVVRFESHSRYYRGAEYSSAPYFLSYTTLLLYLHF